VHCTRGLLVKQLLYGQEFKECGDMPRSRGPNVAPDPYLKADMEVGRRKHSLGVEGG